MADSAVAVTAGSGTNIDTRTEGTNGNHRQVVVIGDPATNAGVAPVDATDGLLVNLGANNDVTVSGVSTSAKQDTIIGHVDSIEGLLTTIDADTSALAGAVSGTEVQVDIVSAPTLTVNAHAVTNAGTFAVQESGAALTALQLIDDSVATDGSAATAKLIQVGGTDGTNAQILSTDSSGRANVNVNGTVPVSSTDLDIRDLTSTDVVTVTGGAGQTADVKVTLDSETVVLGAGSAAIGKLAANSGVDIGDVDVTSLPALAAGTNLIGKVSASMESSTMYDGTTALTPKFAVIDAATSGDNTIVAAVASKKIRVLACFIVAAGAVNVRFESGAGGTAKTGQMNLTTNAGFVLPYNPVGWFETASNTLLNLELSAAVSVDGSLVYVEV